MKRQTKERINFIILWVVVLIAVIAVVSSVVAYAYALIAYGGKPISEVPTWALWFLFSGKGR